MTAAADDHGAPPRADGTRQAEAGKLARRSAFNFVGLAIGNGLQFVMVVLLANALGQHDTGVFFEGFAAMRLLSVVAGLGLDVAMVRYVAMHEARGERAQARRAVRLGLTVAGGLATAVAAATFAVAPFAADQFGTADLEPVLQIMSLSLPATVLQAVLIGATRGTGGMRAFVLVDQVIDGVFRVGAIAAVLALGFGLEATAWAYTGSAFAIAAAAAIAARGVVLGAGQGERGQLADILKFTSYQWGAVVAGVGLLWANTLLLGYFTRDPADVAVYTAVTRAVMAGMIFILPIGVAFQPVIARLYTQGDRPRLASMYSFATKWATLAGAPPLLFLALFASPVIAILYQDSYTRGAWALALLAIGQTVNAATGPCGHIVTMVGRSDLVFKNSIAALAVNLVLSVILIPPFGLVGAGLAWGISVIAWNLFRLYQAWQVLHLQPFRVWPGRAAVVLGVFTAAAAVVRLTLDGAPPLVIVAVGLVLATLAYLAALRATGLVRLGNAWGAMAPALRGRVARP